MVVLLRLIYDICVLISCIYTIKQLDYIFPYFEFSILIILARIIIVIVKRFYGILIHIVRCTSCFQKRNLACWYNPLALNIFYVHTGIKDIYVCYFSFLSLHVNMYIYIYKHKFNKKKKTSSNYKSSTIHVGILLL